MEKTITKYALKNMKFEIINGIKYIIHPELGNIPCTTQKVIEHTYLISYVDGKTPEGSIFYDTEEKDFKTYRNGKWNLNKPEKRIILSNIEQIVDDLIIKIPESIKSHFNLQAYDVISIECMGNKILIQKKRSVDNK
jgi:hypothetical protein